MSFTNYKYLFWKLFHRPKDWHPKIDLCKSEGLTTPVIRDIVKCSFGNSAVFMSLDSDKEKLT